MRSHTQLIDDLIAFFCLQYPDMLLTDLRVLIIIFHLDLLDISIITRSCSDANEGGEYLTICAPGSGVSHWVWQFPFAEKSKTF